MTNQEIIDYYVSLLIVQYASQGNSRAHVAALIGTYLQNQIVEQVDNAWDLRTAIGKQLEMLGSYRGAGRNVFGISPSKVDWSAIPYNDPNPDSYSGWAFYNDPDPTWFWMQYNDLQQLLYSLTDAELRLYIQYLSTVHSSFLSLHQLDAIINTYFGNYVSVTDTGLMSLTFTHHATDPGTLWNIIKNANAIPHPAGVAISIVEAP